MAINVKFVGALRHMAGKSKMVIAWLDNFSIKDLIQKIVLDLPDIKASILNQQTDGALKPNALILVNDREISVLNGLDTLINDGDEVVFIPVVHGG